MRYQSFYPFAQGQTPNFPQSFSGPSQIPFGLGNPGAPRIPNRVPGGALGLGSAAAGLPRGANRVEQFMETADRFLNTAQKLTPMVQQFSPMVQNLPALWKIYRGFQTMPDATATTSTVRNAASATSAASTASAASRISRPSTPRIFQPPI